MNLLDFTHIFPDEASCKRHFREMRENEGVVCSKCGGTSHYWKNDKECFECKTCKHRIGLRSGTVMHGSKMPFRSWYVVMHLLTATKKSFSAKELQRQLGHKRYEPVWTMVHKLRSAMGKRDSLYKLNEEIELDEGFFSTEMPEAEKDKPLKRGRGSQKKTTVLVMVESKEVQEDDKKKNGKRCGHLKMKVIPDLKEATITKEVKTNISQEATIVSDNSTSYVGLKETVKEHKPETMDPKKVAKLLPWVHIAISNAKRLVLDVYHDVKPEYLQMYLDEFCYKFNRRYFGEKLFNRLMVACITTKNDFRR